MTQGLQSFIICPNMMIMRDQKVLLLRRAARVKLLYFFRENHTVLRNDGPSRHRIG